MPIPQSLAQLRLPLIGAPLFIVSNPELVIAQCRAGILGSFPALNARESGELARWLEQIQQALAEPQPAGCPYPVAPFAVNQIVHPSNPRLAEDIELAVRYRVPIMITSLHAPTPVVQAAKTYGGLVFHDVISLRHAEKAIEAGVDGLILVTAGAGGHAGPLNPFAFIEEVRKIYSGTIILSGAMSRGHHILAAQAMGADLAYMGTRFVASAEARAVQSRFDDLFAFEQLHLVPRLSESKALSEHYRPCIIISASGMLEGGRIQHHLRHQLLNSKACILFIGFVAEGTFGRRLLDGEPIWQNDGKKLEVRAQIRRTDVFSGHADHDGLVEFVGSQAPDRLKRVFLTHGDYSAMLALEESLSEKGYRVEIPFKSQIYSL